MLQDTHPDNLSLDELQAHPEIVRYKQATRKAGRYQLGGILSGLVGMIMAGLTVLEPLDYYKNAPTALVTEEACSSALRFVSTYNQNESAVREVRNKLEKNLVEIRESPEFAKAQEELTNIAQRSNYKFFASVFFGFVSLLAVMKSAEYQQIRSTIYSKNKPLLRRFNDEVEDGRIQI